MGARKRRRKFNWTCRKINWITHAAPRLRPARALVAAEGFGSFHGAVGPSVSGKGWAHRARKDAVTKFWMIRLRADLASGLRKLYGCHAVDPVRVWTARSRVRVFYRDCDPDDGLNAAISC